MNNDLRAIEITEGCMGGESTIYLTNAPDHEIEKAIKCIAAGDNKPFNDLEEKYEMLVIVSTLENCFYCDIAPHIKVVRSFDICAYMND